MEHLLHTAWMNFVVKPPGLIKHQIKTQHDIKNAFIYIPQTRGVKTNV